MKILTSLQVKEIDRLTIENEPIASINLMERASLAFVQWFVCRFKPSTSIVVFAGSGNNGGDALAISRMLIERQYKVRVFLVKTGTGLSVDCAINLERLKGYIEVSSLLFSTEEEYPEISHDEIVIDGIFGSGLNRPVEGKVGDLISFINIHSSCVIAIDIPSGLFGDDNRANNPECIIRANYTVSFEFPFLSFFFSENEKYIGKWSVIPIGLHKRSIEAIHSDYCTIESLSICELLIPRKKFTHKGMVGHALVIAGRYGMMGAAVLSTRACLRGGAGLTSASIPLSGYNILQISVPEALIVSGGSDEIYCKNPPLGNYQAIACGPAIGQGMETTEALHQLINKAKVPLVLDADALTILSSHLKWMEKLPEGSIITPHPKEFDRLAGESQDMYSRHLKQLEFARKYKVIVILKGANTMISTPAGQTYVNTTGNPGMASGGTGDVLTGLLVSLLAQGYAPETASVIAVYIHGLAADLVLETSSQESLIASDIIENFGKAYRKVRE